MAALDGELVAWVEESCRRSGVPVKLADARVTRDVALLLSGSAPRLAQRRGERAGSSDAPDEFDALAVELAGSAVATWGDDGVVEQGGDDRVLAGQAQL